MRPRLLVALCALVLTAGCGGLAGDTTDVETLTPAPVPPQPTESGPSVTSQPPGLSENSLSDVERLAERHVAVASDTSFRWESRLEDERREDGEPVSVTTISTTVVRNNSRAFHRDDFARRSGSEANGTTLETFTRAEYVTPSTRYRMVDEVPNEEPTFQRDDQGRARWQYSALSAESIVGYLDLDSSTVTHVDVGQRPHYLINGTKSTVKPYGTVEDYRARALVREDGLVRRIEVRFNATFDRERHRVTYSAEYTDVGSATVAEPGWLPLARNAAETERDAP